VSPTTRPASEVGNPGGSITTFNGKTIDEWIRQMSDDDPSKRTMAVLAVVNFGNASSRAVKALLARVQNDPDTSPRIKAVMALRLVAVHDDEAREIAKQLAQKVHSTAAPPRVEMQSAVRYECLLTLGRFIEDANPEEVLPSLIGGIQDRGSWEIRQLSIHLLTRVARKGRSGPDEKAVRALLQALPKEPTQQVKMDLVCALGSMGKPSDRMLLGDVVTMLKSASTSNNKVYAVWAFAGLVAMEDEVSKESLMMLAQFVPARDRSGYPRSLEVRSQAAQALGALGTRAKGAVPTLVAQLADHETLVVSGACVALAQIGDKNDKVIDAMIPLLSDKDPVRVTAALSALVHLGHLNPKVIAALEKQVERTDKDSDVLKPYFRSALEQVKGAMKK
jgi:HEAT repeat protein